MKKSLLFGSLTALMMLFANFSTAQQNRSSNVSGKNAEQLSYGKPKSNQNSNSANKTAFVPLAVNMPTTTTCMSVNLPVPATWSLVNYGTGTPFAADGFVNGPNTYGDREKAMYFDVSSSANTMITQVYVGFGIAYSAVPTKTVAIKVYNGTGNVVGAALGQGTITMATIMNDVNNNQYSLVMFPTPINLPVSKQFFVSVDVSGLSWPAVGAKDSLSIVSNSNTQTPASTAREKWSDNSWNYINTSWGLNISLLIHPFLTQAPIVANISNSTNTICAGQNVTYSTTGSTAGTYEWDFGSIPSPTATGATTMATYPTAGTFTTLMVVEDACGSFGIATKTVLVKPNPTVTATPPSTTVCNGTNITLNGGGASTYAWTGGITNGTPFAATSSINYTVTGTAANGCTATAVSAVNVNANPNVTANTTTNTVCAGNNITLTGGGAATYVWTGGVTNGTAFAPASSGSYTVTGTAANSCTAAASVSITVNTNPVVTASPGSTTVCSGVNVSFAGGGASTYAWSGGITDGTPFAAASTTNYTVTGTAANGCTATAIAALNVNPTPTLVASASPSSACSGGNVSLTGTGATTYTWSNGISNGASITPTSTATYTVTGSTGACSGSAAVTVNVGSNPTVSATSSSSMICTGSTVTLNGSGATTYTWSNGVTDGTAFTPTGTGAITYTVTGANASGCTGTATVALTVSPCTGIDKAAGNNSFMSIYPNPNNGEFVVSVSSLSENPSIEIHDGIGKLVYKQTIVYEKQNVKANLSQGMYFISFIENGKVVSVQKLISK
ncbi:MAG: hypothetical protein K0S32_104 [Bacteroidetes bacterium]|jgi:hypothetical protein|nr:hypothetical protein [Bacteroidota bacterium]